MNEEWAESFAAFLRDVGPRPTPAHSLDRIKGDKGYEPGNVRWATRMEQSQNRPGFVHALTHRGKTMTLAEWARELGIPAGRIYKRVQQGLSASEALEPGLMPRGAPPRNLTLDGETLPLKAWARKAGIHPDTLRKRPDKGMELRQALIKPA
jgi:hypothetical protein